MNDIDKTKRDLLKVVVLGSVLFIIPTSIIDVVLRSLSNNKRNAINKIPEIYGYNWLTHCWGFAIDIKKCIGCGKCIEACKLENNVARGKNYARTWVERYVIIEGKTPIDREVIVDVISDVGDKFPERAELSDLPIVRAYFVPKLCNLCENPPCVRVCPVGATFKTKDGVILVDKKWCIGCGYCIQTCPYGARFLDPRTGTADKCTLCYHRITKGLRPACVEACPTGARIFGDLKDPKSEISELLKKKMYDVLKPYYNTDPKVYYIDGLPEEVR